MGILTSMAKKKTTLKVTNDFTTEFNNIIQGLKKSQVLVGVPEEKSTRKEAKDTNGINNATLLAINEYGSPVNNIPSRPVLTIGIRNAKDEIAKQFGLAASVSLDKGVSSVDRYLERAGIIASNSVKKTINSGEGFRGPAESTLKSRESKGFKGTKSLIVTGQLRNSITYVVTKKD